MKLKTGLFFLCCIVVTYTPWGFSETKPKTQPLQAEKDAPWSVDSGETKVHLIELFSSEGCSSCPPADRWLSSQKRRDDLWKNFVPVKFQVDYWNKLGWVDRYSNSEFTRRQHAYAAAWNQRSVYTPAFVLDGQEWRTNWKKGFKRAVPDKSSEKVGVLTAAQTKPGAMTFNVTFNPTDKKVKDWTIHAALLGVDVVSKVKAGENQGKTLHHDFVVLDLKVIRAINDGDVFKTTLALEDQGKAAPGNYAVAFWVSKYKSIVPVQAIGNVLPRT